MKLVYKNYRAVLFCLFLVGTLTQTALAASKTEFTKSIKKDFSINLDGTAKFSNRYGKMTINTWDKDRVKINILITVNATSESNAQEVFNRISIDFENSADFVSAETQIANNSNSWWSGWSDNDKSDFRINYEVYMPRSVSLDLKNRYGDAYIEKLENNATIDVKYGDFNMDGVGKALNVVLGYGNGNIVQAGNTDASISYSKFRLQKCKNGTFSSKYSKIAINEAEDLRINSAYDTYDIGTVQNYHSQGKYDNVSINKANNIVAFSKYSDYTVEHLTNSADFDLTYGGAKVNYIAKGFSEMRIVGKYADFRLNVENEASYQLDASADYAGIRYPKAMNVKYENDKGSSHQVEGFVHIKEARSVIKVRLAYGGLKIE